MENQKNLEVGAIVVGEVINITNFGAFVRMENKEEGLIHISEMANQYVKNINDFVNLGDKVTVKILGRNAKNKLELSIKQTGESETVPKSETKTPEKKATPPPIKKTKNEGFEDKITLFLKKSEEKQIDIRRNLKNKQGIRKRSKQKL